MKKYTLVYLYFLSIASFNCYAIIPYVEEKNQNLEPITTDYKPTFSNTKIITIKSNDNKENFLSDFIDDVSQNVNTDDTNGNNKDNQQNVENRDNNTKILNGLESSDILESGIDNLDKTTPDIPLNAIAPNTLKTFVKVIDLVRRNYIEPVNDEKLLADSMQGMLKNLDPHAELLDAQSYANLQAFTQGDLAETGIDVEFDKKQGNWVVQRVVPNSSADLQGIKDGYYIHKINDLKLDEKTRKHDVKQSLQGFAGSMVDLTVSDSGRRVEKITLQRTLSTLTSIKVTSEQGIAIVNIPTFQENSRQEMLDQLVSLKVPIYGVILDLRDNPGGVLSSAVDVASLFMTNSEVVKVANRNGAVNTLKTQDFSYLDDIPLLVLQNRYSASAAEVLASSLQYNKRATIVGETSYGKGTVQSVIAIDNGQAVKLTVAKYLRPDNKTIDGIGVSPDITLVNEDHEQFYQNLLSVVAPSDTANDVNEIQPFRLKTVSMVSAEDRAKLANEVKWQKQAVNILLAQINSQPSIKPPTQRDNSNRLNKVPSTESNPDVPSKPTGIMLVYPTKEAS